MGVPRCNTELERHCRKAAADYAQLGWAPIPLKRRSKTPDLVELRPYLERRATREELRSWDWTGVGIVTGPLSGIVVLDADGEEGMAELKRRGHPVTPVARTGKGLHLYFRHPGEDLRTGIRIAPGIDLKAAGGYVAAPPSAHPNGRDYKWIIPPEDTELADLPEWALDTLKSERPRRYKAITESDDPIGPGQRNATLYSYACYLRSHGFSAQDIEDLLQKKNLRRCFPPLDTDEVGRIAQSAATHEQGSFRPDRNGHSGAEPSSGEAGGFNLTDLGNAERLVALHGRDVRYVYAWARWLVYDGRRWIVDDAGEVERRAKETARGIYHEAATAPTEAERKALADHAKRSEAKSRIADMIALAQSEPGIPVSPVMLDADPWLLNVENGTVDLRTGDLREHRRDDLITKMAGTRYEVAAPAPAFGSFLDRVLPSAELQRFVQRVVGYCLTGDVSEQALLFLHGAGANGKSTLINAILAMLGEYGQQAAPDLLAAKTGTHPTELADLKGARFAASVEVEDGRRLAESLVKQLTGGDRIKARFMRQDFFEFDPTHKVFLAANHKPVIRGTDHAIWRRIKLVPFEVTVPKKEQDPRLFEKLGAELPGILAWAVRGCSEWQRNGLGEPDEVRRATEGYRSEMDVLAAFLEERCVLLRNAETQATPLYEAYRHWSDENGERPENQRRFGTRLSERGFEKAKRGGVYYWFGIGLRHDGPGPSGPSGPETAINTKNLPHEAVMAEKGPKGPKGPDAANDDGPGGKTPPRRPLTEPEAQHVQKLISEGMSPKFARAEVLGEEG